MTNYASDSLKNSSKHIHGKLYERYLVYLAAEVTPNASHNLLVDVLSTVSLTFGLNTIFP